MRVWQLLGADTRFAPNHLKNGPMRGEAYNCGSKSRKLFYTVKYCVLLSQELEAEEDDDDDEVEDEDENKDGLSSNIYVDDTEEERDEDA